MPGVAPRRVTVDASDLRAFAPGTRSVVVERALRHVRSIVVDGVGARDAVLWGHSLQQAYGDLVSRSLVLSGSDIFARVEAYLDRMTVILRSVDLGAIFATAAPSSIIERLLDRRTGRIETQAAFQAACAEIEQLVGLIGAAQDGLLSLRDEIERLIAETDALARELEAAALAAEFLSVELRDERPEVARRFLERAMSLTQSVSQIVEGGPVRAEQAERPLRLVGLIQDVVLVTVPGWLAAASALRATATRAGGPTPTQTGELAHGLQGILQRLGN